MEIRICPECDKAFYAFLDSDAVVCTHCGLIVRDRRRAERVHEEFDCSFSVKGHIVRAKLQDYSASGLRMIYTGTALEADTILDVEIEGLDVHRMAKTVWSVKTSKNSVAAGLRLL